MFHLLRIIFFSLVLLTSPADAAIRIQDEGTVKGYAWDVDCVGAGVLCEVTSSKLTLTVTGSGGSSSGVNWDTIDQVQSIDEDWLFVIHDLDTSTDMSINWDDFQALLPGSGDVTAASAFGTDNVLIKSDGTGKGVQATGISIADTTNNMTGVGTIDASGYTEGASNTLSNDISGNSATATALAANGDNCPAGSYPLGVDASGEVETCTDATTEINSAISTHTGDADAHQDLVTLAGTPDYITISGQIITRGTIDIGDDTNLAVSSPITLTGDTVGIGTVDISDNTNLAGDSEIVLTGDTLSIASSIARDSELHDAVTFAGTGTYISLAGQQITVDPLTESDIEDLEHTTDQVGTLNSGDLCVNDGSIVNCTVNTEAELETALDATNVIVSTEIDSYSEINTIVADATLYASGQTDVALADGGTGASLVDPNEDAIFFWDDSAGTTAFLTVGSGLTISGTTIETTGVGGAIDGSGTTNEITYWVDSDTLGALAVATYPSLTELSYVKGVTSSLQTQLNAKQDTLTLGTGVETALGVNVGSAGAFVTFNGALGTPSSGTLTNATGLPVSTGISGLGTGVATFLGTPSSANLASAVTGETGSGALVFGTSPTISLASASTASTASANDNDTSVSTTAFVQQEINGAGGTGLTCSSGVCNVDLGTDISISELALTLGDGLTATANTISGIPDTKNFSISGVTEDSDNLVQPQWDYDINITEVCGSTDTGTVTIQFDERGETTPNSAGTDVLTSNLVADNNQQCTTAFDNEGILATSVLNMIVVATSGSPTTLRVRISSEHQ